MKREKSSIKRTALSLVALFLVAGFTMPATAQEGIDLSDEQVEHIVRRSYPYVALYNLTHKFALDESGPMYVGGWNEIHANTALADHTLQSIARPNNDTLYLSAMIDARREPIILEFPAFDSRYVSLMVTAYDHYVNIPMSTTKGDFDKSSRILFYSQRTPGYRGDPVPGVDRIMELTGDFVSAVIRVMPHANEPARLKRNLTAMRETHLLTLSEYLEQGVAEVEFVPWQTPPGVERNLDLRRHKAEFPPFRRTDFDIFEDNLLEVMQFVFNHTTFDPKDDNDQALLAAYKPLGVEPGKAFQPKTVPQINGQQFRSVAQAVARHEMARMNDPENVKDFATRIFLPKGEMDQELLVFLSIVGPIGQPAREALYPPITAADGKPMNAMHDYVIRMDANSLPPANAFWSLTLYDTENGFFIPNDSKKYSVGENAGMQLNAQGGIEIHVAAEKPDGVPPENWLPVNRGDYGIDLLMRIYAPDLGRYRTWSPPKAERIK
ncbi:MAG: DUF1254 domain-containing protein [Proteobacteria bacterium]|nr:DUF1254 domain-containing protein [Pseudomonadota bacterium]